MTNATNEYWFLDGMKFKIKLNPFNLFYFPVIIPLIIGIFNNLLNPAQNIINANPFLPILINLINTQLPQLLINNKRFLINIQLLPLLLGGFKVLLGWLEEKR